MTELLIAPPSAHALVTVAVEAADPITHAGLVSRLRRTRAVSIVAPGDGRAAVVLLAVGALDAAALRRVQHYGERGVRIVLVIARLEPAVVPAVLEHGVRAVLTRCEADAERLIGTIRAVAAGGVDLPPRLLRHSAERVVKRPVARRLHVAELSPREHDVLTLIAEGFSTREVAARLAYSERTIKNVLQEITGRLHLRNRTQAVAHAVRNGWI